MFICELIQLNNSITECNYLQLYTTRLRGGQEFGRHVKHGTLAWDVFVRPFISEIANRFRAYERDCQPCNSTGKQYDSKIKVCRKTIEVLSEVKYDTIKDTKYKDEFNQSSRNRTGGETWFVTFANNTVCDTACNRWNSNKVACPRQTT